MEKEKDKKNKEEKLKKIKKKNQNEKTLIWILVIIFGIIASIAGFYFYTQSQMHFNYKGIEFSAVNEGTTSDPLIFYKTDTLAEPNDGTNSLFGFRIRTKPTKLEKIPFENLENFELMKINGYNYEEGTFNCEGYGVIAMPNLQRVFQKTGMTFIHDENATCDIEGRYNFFLFKYGDKTEIKEVGENCYEVVIEGNDEECEILPATEKLMVEIFVKYLEL
jgi:hypothetical protein